MPCPLCRKKFSIPADGLSKMKKNFEKEKLLHVSKPLAAEKAQQMNMCEQHKEKQIEVFCRDCKVAICVKCVITSHKTHDRLDIEKVSEDLRKQLLSDKASVSELCKRTGELLPRLEREKNDVIKYLAGIEDEINTAADKLIAAIQLDKVKLLSKVASIKLKRVKQLEMVKQKLEQHMTALESFMRYSETLLSSGTACDVVRAANSLHVRANALMMCDIIGHVDSSLPPVNVTLPHPRCWVEITEILLEQSLK